MNYVVRCTCREGLVWLFALPGSTEQLPQRRIPKTGEVVPEVASEVGWDWLYGYQDCW